MSQISEASCEALIFLKSAGGNLLEDRYLFPHSRIQLLLRDKLISTYTLLPPGKEDEYPRRLTGYHLTAEGEDALVEFEKVRNQQANGA